MDPWELPRSSPLAAVSPRRRWGEGRTPPALHDGTVVDITISPPGSPHAAWPHGSSACTSPGSPHMFQLSPDVPAALGPAVPLAGDSDGCSEATGDDGDDLVSFLADLKSKYGLIDPAEAASASAASPARQHPPRSPQKQQHPTQPPPPRQHPQTAAALPPPSQQVSVRVVVHKSSSGTSSEQSVRQQQEEEQGQGQEESSAVSTAAAEAGQEGPSYSVPPDTTWMAEGEMPPALALAGLINNPVFDPSASSGGNPLGEQQQAGALDQQLEAELAALEELQRQTMAQEEEQKQQEAEQGDASDVQHPETGTGEAASADEPPGWAVPPVQPRRLPWGSLHTLLVQRGFPGLLPPTLNGTAAHLADYSDLQPDPAALFETMHSMLKEHARSSSHQQRLTEAVQAASRREGAIVAGFTSAAKRREAEVVRWKRLAVDNQVAARDAVLSSRQSGRAGEAAAAEARRLEGMVDQLEHQLRSKESELERLRAMLRLQQERDERRADEDRYALERLKRAYAASKATDTESGAAATVKAAAKDMRPVDICRVFEAQRANLAEQAALAAADAAAATAKLAHAQELLHSAGLPCERFDEIEGQARTAARQAAAADERAAQLAEEASMLRLEVAARPTQGQYDSLKRQVDIMERQLAKANAEKAAAAEQEQEQRAGGDAKQRPPRRQLSTRDMILRDRNMQRLGLQCVEELPKPVLVELVQDACALLECRQPLELCGAIRPVQDTAALVPRMERFIGDVCGAVFQRGLAHVPEALRQDNPSDVPAILATWIAELGELVEMRGVLRALLRQLASRVSLQPNDPAPTAGEVVPLVASLVELERQVFHSREVIQAAETALAAQPEVLTHRICQHFQRLFGCRGLEGVLPTMNKLYLAHTEAQTFLSSLRTALGLEASATLEGCANRLEQLLADKRDVLATMLPTRPPHAPAAVGLPASAAAVVVEVAPPQRGRSRDSELQQAAQVAVERMAARRHWPQVQIYVPVATAAGEVQG